MQLNIQNKKSIFAKGYLNNMATEVLTKVKIEKLENHSLTRIATILGHLSKDYDLYNVLFEQPNQELMVDNTKINTKDLASFVLMDHLTTRGYFARQAGGRAQNDTTNSQGVPLALEGAKRLYNKTYMSWLDGYDLSNIEQMFRIDIFLPGHLASIDIDAEGVPQKRKKHGLLVLLNNDINFPSSVINQIREQVPNYLTSPNPKLINADLIDGIYGELYNKCEHKLRCMLLQGWIFDPKCTNDAMITNVLDWDSPAKPVSFEGIMPKGEGMTIGFTKFLGIKQ
jgi:hypothetical protein